MTLTLRRYLITLPYEKWLEACYIVMLLARFLYPAFDNPLSHIFSDPGRHWENGGRLFKPTLMGSIDPKLFQYWIWVVRHITHDDKLEVALFSGFLCAALPWLWYRCCKEFMPRLHARIFALIVGSTPLLLTIYSYFMVETLMLDVVALAFWLTFRAARKRTDWACAWAGFAWVLCMFTRSTAIPLALFGGGYLFCHAVRRIPLITGCTAILILCSIPAGMHSYERLHIFAPFQYGGLGRLTYLANTEVFQLHTDYGWYEFSSPTFYYPPLEPIHFESLRPHAITTFNIRTAQGEQDWDSEIANAQKSRDAVVVARDMLENAVFFVFGASWPDSSFDNPSLLLRLSFQMRWLWPFLMILIAWKAPKMKLPPPQAFMMMVTVVFTTMLLLQTYGLIEGRYRKPVEPLLLLSGYFIIVRPPGRYGNEGAVTLYQVFKDTYINPYLPYVHALCRSLSRLNTH